MTDKNLLVELFVEELPPKALKKLGEAFSTLLADSLKAQGLTAADARITAFASPRRLAVHIVGVAPKAADRQLLQKLMPVAVALDAEGQPTQALLKKLAAIGAADVPVSQLRRQGEGKAEALFHDSLIPGATLAEGLQQALDDTLASLPIPKVMSYQLADGWSSVHFVRPAHGLVALHGGDVVPVSALGLQAHRITYGHRFEAAESPLMLRDADSYAQQLQDEGAVIPAFVARRAEILRQLQAAARALGLRPIEDEALLDEVTGLVERPNVLACQFDAQFLDVPSECLILTMKANQKYFPLVDADGRLTRHFLVVSNIRPADASRIVEGNQRVVRPRLADAKFFFDQDRKRTLESRVPALAKVVYHGKLGTQGERVERVRALARAIGEQLGGPALAASADRGALLAKADLVSDMVGEFPELQGIMGGYYARHDGETEDVAFAIEDHYKPRFAGDELPRRPAGVAVALADKLETLAGLFVVRMLIERALPLDTEALVLLAFKAFGAQHGQAQAELALFLRERLVGYLREQGHSAQEVDAVLELRPERWADVPARLAALRRFAALPEAPALAAANKRVGNILKKSDGGASATVQPALFGDPAESALHTALQGVSRRADAAFDAGDLAGSLQALAALKAPVDDFFDKVMVNAEDPALRDNRLALLGQLHAAMNRVADLSKLAA
ncbi:MAG: glycine--tRNA ligase subunit beta [Burkholderiaceae bacterium]|nr:glycine--tRNA ligase subunit beta [Burkholderiaceae bacterium]